MPDQKSPRLIPQYRSREVRAVSALLAVLEVSPTFSDLLIGKLGATVPRRVSAEIEPVMGVGGRADGYVRADNRRSSWSMLIEAKAGNGKLNQLQVDREWEEACARGYDCLLTISNDLHTTVVPSKRSRNTRTRAEHLSWMEILTMARDAMRRIPDDSRAEKRVVKELVRYLDDPATAVLMFDKMPGCWPEVLRRLQEGSYKTPDPELIDVVRRIDELFTYCSLRLFSEFDDVVAYESRTSLDSLAEDAIAGKQIVGRLESPQLSGPLELGVNLKDRTLTCSATIPPYSSEQPTTSARALTRRLETCESPFKRQVFLETWEAHGRTRASSMTVSQAIEDPRQLVPNGRGKKIKEFRLSRQTAFATRGYKRGKSPGFIQDVDKKLEWFYEPLRELSI